MYHSPGDLSGTVVFGCECSVVWVEVSWVRWGKCGALESDEMVLDLLWTSCMAQGMWLEQGNQLIQFARGFPSVGTEKSHAPGNFQVLGKLEQLAPDCSEFKTSRSMSWELLQG